MADNRLRDFTGASSEEIERALESGEIVYFERCPIELPAEAELTFLRDRLPGRLKAKNVSYHPESDSIPRFEAEPEIKARVLSILKGHASCVADFLRDTLPNLSRDLRIGTTSFRPVEERNRNLKPRSSNEIVHIDAGAYGATNGDRILRFFVNVNPTRERVWGTKGDFAGLLERHPELLAAARGGSERVQIRKRWRDHLYSGTVRAAARAFPLLRVLDSSPYDRAMRRIHNYMKEDAVFRADNANYRELRFSPLSAWIVLTDGVSHSVLSGQHALVTTALVPLANCRLAAKTPYHVLAAGGGPAG